MILYSKFWRFYLINDINKSFPKFRYFKSIKSFEKEFNNCFDINKELKEEREVKKQ